MKTYSNPLDCRDWARVWIHCLKKGHHIPEPKGTSDFLEQKVCIFQHPCRCVLIFSTVLDEQKDTPLQEDSLTQINGDLSRQSRRGHLSLCYYLHRLGLDFYSQITLLTSFFSINPAKKFQISNERKKRDQNTTKISLGPFDIGRRSTIK